MYTFGKTLFGGYQKDEVDTYVKRLQKQLDEAGVREEELQKAQCELEEAKNEIEKLKREAERLQREHAQILAERDETIRNLEEEREAAAAEKAAAEVEPASYNAIAKVLLFAEENAEKTRESARKDAEELRAEAAEEIAGQKEAFVKEAKQTVYKLVHMAHDLTEYQVKMRSLYKEMGELFTTMPASLEEAIPCELLEMVGESTAENETERDDGADEDQVEE